MDIGIVLLGILCGIGSVWVVRVLLIPLCDVIVFSIGYTIFRVIHLSLTKIIKRPDRFIGFVIISFLRGFIKRTCDFGTLESSKTSKWIWKPYFHYERIGNNNE